MTSVAPAAAFVWEAWDAMAIEWIVAAVLAAMFATWCLSAWWWWP